MIALIEYATWLIGEGHTVVYSHWQSAAGIALAFLLSLLEDAAKFNEMTTTTEVRSLCKAASVNHWQKPVYFLQLCHPQTMQVAVSVDT